MSLTKEKAFCCLFCLFTIQIFFYLQKELGVAKQHLQTLDKKIGGIPKIDSSLVKKRKKQGKK